MNPRFYKHPRSTTSLGVRLFVLSFHQIESAQAGADSWGSRNNAAPGMVAVESAVQLVCRAARLPASTVRQFHRSQLLSLASAWVRHQAANTPDAKRLEAALRLSMTRDPMVQVDGAMAHQAVDAAAYYGKPTHALTPGQLTYYWTLRTVYHDQVIDADKGRSYSRQWLKRQAQGDC